MRRKPSPSIWRGSLTLLLTSLLCAYNSAAAQNAGPIGLVHARAEISILNRYIWRGLVMTDEAVGQASVRVEHDGLHFRFWGNMDQTDINGHQREFNNVQLTLGYGYEAFLVGYAAGLTHYTFPGTLAQPTTEFFVSIAGDFLAHPSLTLYYDIDVVDAVFLQLDLSHRVALAAGAAAVVPALEARLRFGYGSREFSRHYYSAPGSGLAEFYAGIALPIDLAGGWRIAPGVAYNSVPDNELADISGRVAETIIGMEITRTF